MAPLRIATTAVAGALLPMAACCVGMLLAPQLMLEALYDPRVQPLLEPLALVVVWLFAGLFDESTVGALQSDAAPFFYFSSLALLSSVGGAALGTVIGLASSDGREVGSGAP